MRVYLMLGSAGPLDRDLVRAWMAAGLAGNLPGRDPGADARHPVAPPRCPDGAAVAGDPARRRADRGGARARSAASRWRSASIRASAPSAAAKRLPPWRPADALGAAGARDVRARLGQAADRRHPGLLHRRRLPQGAAAVARRAPRGRSRPKAGCWAARAELAPDGAEALRLERDVVALYEADYAKQWDAMLADLNVVPLRSPAAGRARALYPRLAAIADARSAGLDRAPADPVPAAVRRRRRGSRQGCSARTWPSPRSSGECRRRRFGCSRWRRRRRPGSGSNLRARRSTSATASCATMSATAPGAPIEQAYKAMDALRQQLARLAQPAQHDRRRRRRDTAAPGGEDATALLRAEASSAPAPVNRWLEAMIGSSTALRTGSTAEQVKKSFNASGGPASLCKQAVNGRYPFERASSRDIPLDDFTKLFAPGGLIDGFFNTQLRPYVDASASVWKGQTARRRGGADRAGRIGAVPARRRDPRSVLRRRRRRAVAAFRPDPGLSRSRHKAGHARTRRHHCQFCPGSAEGDADHLAGLRDEHRPAGVRPAAEQRLARIFRQPDPGRSSACSNRAICSRPTRPNAIS